MPSGPAQTWCLSQRENAGLFAGAGRLPNCTLPEIQAGILASTSGMRMCAFRMRAAHTTDPLFGEETHNQFDIY